jgi:hypothetical protein
VSFETSFDSKLPKLEPKLVSALSETKLLFRLFRFYTETASFGVSIEPKQTETRKQNEKNIYKPFKMSSPPPSFPYTHKTRGYESGDFSLQGKKRVSRYSQITSSFSIIY